MDELIRNVIQWANDRNIIQGSTAIKQLEKTAAEVIELAIEIGKEEVYVEQRCLTQEQMTKTASELGDVLVTLIVISEQLGFSLEDCLQTAYEKIKDRKGEMRGGKWVKESDL